MSVILFLNKMDLLEAKFGAKGAGARLKEAFPAYTGMEGMPCCCSRGVRCTSRGKARCVPGFTSAVHPHPRVTPTFIPLPTPLGEDDVRKAMVFIQSLFVDVSKTALPQLPGQHALVGKGLYTHFTCAVNTDQIRTVFNASRDIILRLNLAKLGLV